MGRTEVSPTRVDHDEPAYSRHRVPTQILHAIAGSPLRFLRSGWPWHALRYLTGGALAVVPLLALHKWTSEVGTAAAYLTAATGLVVVCLVAAAPLAALERRRLGMLGMGIASSRGPSHSAEPHGSPWGRLLSLPLWREWAYCLLLVVVLGIVDLFAVLAAATVLILPATPLLEFLMDIESMVNLGPPGTAPTTGFVAKTVTVLVGLILLPIAAYGVALLAAWQGSLARWLLRPRGREITGWGRRSMSSRAWLAHVCEAERRRIERDLHDGAQQRLVALILQLGIAEIDLRNCQCDAGETVVAARREAERVLADLRQLIRGIHPQVLTDHGLGPAVAELAARCPLAVTVRLDLPRRPGPEVEAAAYFVVSEGLANIVKHSRAERAEVRGRLEGDRLALSVWDDGVGGAEPAAGSGLRGLADRVAVVGGRVMLTSPRGGPTTLFVDLPQLVTDAV
ncbi:MULTISPECIES: sensor histidine kinase [Actinoalloteichus]|uniref:sensor histidine kinase n=2 Tax=Pseudonocardiaceae TaxID=2070 RepID=UPI00138DDA68|nr:histidine kinase [Actinoalloteichus caeruleus]